MQLDRTVMQCRRKFLCCDISILLKLATIYIEISRLHAPNCIILFYHNWFMTVVYSFLIFSWNKCIHVCLMLRKWTVCIACILQVVRSISIHSFVSMHIRKMLTKYCEYERG